MAATLRNPCETIERTQTDTITIVLAIVLFPLLSFLLYFSVLWRSSRLSSLELPFSLGLHLCLSSLLILLSDLFHSCVFNSTPSPHLFLELQSRGFIPEAVLCPIVVCAHPCLPCTSPTVTKEPPRYWVRHGGSLKSSPFLSPSFPIISKLLSVLTLYFWSFFLSSASLLEPSFSSSSIWIAPTAYLPLIAHKCCPL